MPRPSSASALTVATLIAIAGAVAGCETPGSGIQEGESVTVYVSMPLRGASGVDGRDVVRGAKLALADANGRAGALSVRAVYLDDTAGPAPDARWTQAKAAANARRAAEDSTAIAYLGDFDSGATRSSLPITNQARILQVSPASAAIDLVQPFLGAGDQVPEDVQPTGDRTFGRVIPSDEAQAEAGAAWAKRLGGGRVRVASDRSGFGDVMRSAFADEARGLGLDVRRLERLPLRAHAEGVYACTAVARLGAPVVQYYAGTRTPSVEPVPCLATTLLMASDALLHRDALARLRQVNLLVTSAAQDPSQLPPAGQRFVRAYRDRYGEPGRYAAYGYEGMAVVLDSIRRAGDRGDDRDAVVDAFFDTGDRDSVLGTYSIDEVGDTTLDRLAGYRISGGRPVFDTVLQAP